MDIAEAEVALVHFKPYCWPRGTVVNVAVLKSMPPKFSVFFGWRRWRMIGTRGSPSPGAGETHGFRKAQFTKRTRALVADLS
jgi:phage terminase large subunit-like protein